MPTVVLVTGSRAAAHLGGTVWREIPWPSLPPYFDVPADSPPPVSLDESPPLEMHLKKRSFRLEATDYSTLRGYYYEKY